MAIIQDEKMLSNIKNYAEQIKTIEIFVDAVRQNPGQFIGYLGNKGFINMIREIFQNSIDELVKNDSPCDHIKVSFNETDHTVIVEDNGRGIPFNNIIRIFTSEHTSSNYVKKEGEFSSGLHGVGSKVTNALSSTFIVDSYVLGEGRHVEFFNGKPWDKGEQKIKCSKDKQGTKVEFRPSYEIMGNITTTCKDVLGLIQKILPLIKIGAVIDFVGITHDGKVIQERLINKDGIITDLIMKTNKPLIKPVIMQKATGIMKADLAFTYDSNDLISEDITSFSNFCPTIGGKHLEGFIDGICKFFREYMNKIYLSNSKKLSVKDSDIRTGLKAIVSVAHLKPIFSGQAKEILDNDDMYGFVKGLIINSLEQWSKENPQDLQKLCKFYKDVAELRVKSDESRVKLTNKYKSNSLSQGMPEKYVKPNGDYRKNKWELFIVEGDSALGSLRNSRDNKCQGIFPIRGKLPNAFATRKEEFLKNQEIASLLTIIYEDYARNKGNIDRVKWDKIIILTDADCDGNHIRSLALRFFIMYCPELIKAGKVYAAMPPLYSIEVKGKKQYFTDRHEYAEYIVNRFSAQSDVYSYPDKKKLSNKQITTLLYKNMDYLSLMNSITSTFATDPLFLEFILANYHLPFDKFKKLIEKEYRFVTVSKENNSINIVGLVGDKYQTIFLNDLFIEIVKNVVKYIHNSDLYYYFGDNKISLYTLMSKLDDYSPSNIRRYKGLGEMPQKDLASSTTAPDTNRTLIRFNIDNLKKEMQAIREVETDKSILLKDINISKEDVMD